MVAAASWDKLPEWLQRSCNNTINKTFCPNPLFSLELIDHRLRGKVTKPAVASITVRLSLCCASALKVRGRIHLCSLAFGTSRVSGFLGLGTGLCFGSVLVRVLTSLVRRPWLFTSLETILVVQETCLPSQSLSDTHPHTHKTSVVIWVWFFFSVLCI